MTSGEAHLLVAVLHGEGMADHLKEHNPDALPLVANGWTIDSALTHLEGGCDRAICTGEHADEVSTDDPDYVSLYATDESLTATVYGEKAGLIEVAVAWGQSEQGRSFGTNDDTVLASVLTRLNITITPECG